MLMKRMMFLVLFCIMALGCNRVESGIAPSRIEVCDSSFLSATEVNDSIIYLALVHYNVLHPKEVLAQAKLESNNFKSNLFRYHNNFLGLYNSKKKSYYKFDHWTDCILAYKSKIEYKHKNGENYYHFLKRIGYAEDPQYVSKVKKIVASLRV